MTKWLVLALFALTYILLLIFPKRRAIVALAAALILIAAGVIPVNKIFYTINWNVLMMIAGTMGLVSLFIESKMPALLGDLIISKSPDVKWAILLLSLLAGLISAFVDNVATVLMIAPIVMTVSKKLDISPVPGIIAISISSNLQGAATLVGDTTSILLSGQAGLDFFDFFFFQGKAGMFWVVQISAIAASLVLLFNLRKQNKKIAMEERSAVTDYFPTVLLLGTIVLLILASFIPAGSKPEVTNGLICMTLFIFGLARKFIETRRAETIKKALKDIDIATLVLLAGLFIVVGSLTEAGVVDEISRAFVSISNDNVFLLYSLLVWASVLLSAFIDNIPYVAAMLPVTAGIAAQMGISPNLLYFGLLTGATLGGNLTPIGASANIAALGILRKEGHEVATPAFMKISVPFTLTAVIVGYFLVWFIWR